MGRPKSHYPAATPTAISLAVTPSSTALRQPAATRPAASRIAAATSVIAAPSSYTIRTQRWLAPPGRLERAQPSGGRDCP